MNFCQFQNYKQFLVLLFLLVSTSLYASKNTTILNEHEKEWLVKHPLVKVGVGADWAPLIL